MNEVEREAKMSLGFSTINELCENDMACATLYKHILLDLLNNNHMRILDLVDLELFAGKIRSNKQTRGITLFCNMVGCVD